MIFAVCLEVVDYETREYALFASISRSALTSPRGTSLLLTTTIAAWIWFSFHHIWTLLVMIRRHGSISVFGLQSFSC